MIKVRVWTKGSFAIKSKCIFIGAVAVLPRNGESVVVKEGFCEVVVVEVCHHFDDVRVDIMVGAVDSDDEYGPCLING